MSASLRPAGIALAGVALFAFGFAVGELADGIAEVPRHWWSTLSLLGLALAAALWVAGGRLRSAGR